MAPGGKTGPPLPRPLDHLQRRLLEKLHREDEHREALVLRLLVVIAVMDLLRDDRQAEEAEAVIVVEAADGYPRFFRVASAVQNIENRAAP